MKILTWAYTLKLTQYLEQCPKFPTSSPAPVANMIQRSMTPNVPKSILEQDREASPRSHQAITYPPIRENIVVDSDSEPIASQRRLARKMNVSGPMRPTAGNDKIDGLCRVNLDRRRGLTEAADDTILVPQSSLHDDGSASRPVVDALTVDASEEADGKDTPTGTGHDPRKAPPRKRAWSPTFMENSAPTKIPRLLYASIDQELSRRSSSTLSSLGTGHSSSLDPQTSSTPPEISSRSGIIESINSQGACSPARNKPAKGLACDTDPWTDTQEAPQRQPGKGLTFTCHRCTRLQIECNHERPCDRCNKSSHGQ